MLTLYEAGKTTREIGEAVGVVNSTVSKVLRRDYGVRKRKAVKRHKLTKEQKLEARRLYEAGDDYRALAKRYGVSLPCIGDALRSVDTKIRTGWSKYRVTPYVDRLGRRHLFKSSWEVAYAKHLDALAKDWGYEETSYPLGRRRKYTPDFFVYEGGELVELVEVHGWMDKPTRERLELLVQRYPELPLELLGPAEMAALGLVEAWYADHHQAAPVTALRAKLAALKAA